MPPNTAVTVVGGGLAGLAAATLTARAGMPTTLFEKAPRLGGRAITEKHQGFSFNLGPHALYTAGTAHQVLRELGVRPVGSPPPSRGLKLWTENKLQRLPSEPVSLLTSRAFGLRAKLELARFFASLPRLNPIPWRGCSAQQWIDSCLTQQSARTFAAALLRLSTYCHALDLLDASAAIHQLQLALSSGVLYLHDGWQTLVDGLKQVARDSGVHIETSHRVKAVLVENRVTGVLLADGTQHRASEVILALGPQQATRLLDPERHSDLHNAAHAAIPIYAACLDLGLKSLPTQDTLFALGVDHPLYFSVHSAVADLAPPGGALVHVARYLNPRDRLARDELATELETFTDQVQPGFQDLIVERRFMPKMLVSQAIRRFDSPPLEVASRDTEGLFFAGDWVGQEGMLADAALASARSAARAAMTPSEERRAA